LGGGGCAGRQVAPAGLSGAYEEERKQKQKLKDTMVAKKLQIFILGN